MSKNDFFEEKKLKKLVLVFSATLLISIVAFVFIFVMYNKKLREESSNSLSALSALNSIVSNNNTTEIQGVEETSSTSDKTINDVSNAVNTISNTNTVATTAKDITNTENENVEETSQEINQEDNQEEITEETQEKELEFMAPVSGEIIKDYAMDTLIYSETLEEWTTHSGIDISADKTTVVVSSEDGTVDTIKNDPRYGLTITISHSNGFKTVYSNLLTTEFVSEGQTVEKGQTIGTVGESASFEIADNPHLHFEMYKDGECVNPTIYLK